jgi:hypothetical protein
MRNPRLAVPGARPAATAATVRARAIIAAHLVTPVELPMDGDAGGTGAAPTSGAPAGGDGGAPAAPVVPPAGGTTAGGTGQPPTPAAPLPGPVVTSTTTPPGPPSPATGYGTDPLAGATPSTRPPGERSLDEFPADVRQYIADLRKESGEHRVKAKTAEDAAAAAANAAKEEWAEKIARAFGLVEDVPGDPEVTPEQRVEQVTAQLEKAQGEHRGAQVELAIWKAAHAHGANPQRLTDSRAFMSKVGGLDPSADDFASKVEAAIGAAVTADDYYKAAPPPGQVPAGPPPVPSGGEFAGGPRGGSTEPQTADEFVAARRAAREQRAAAGVR